MARFVLGRKQTSDDASWRQVWDHVEDYVSKQEVDLVLEQAVDLVKEATGGSTDGVAYAWSGGKDSVALSFVMEQAGVRRGVRKTCHLEYPAFEKWVAKHRPDGVEDEVLDHDLEWLARNPGMLFPATQHTEQRWISLIHVGQKRYYRRHGLRMLALGRRRADGNVVRMDEPLYTVKAGFTWLNPIQDWRHEHVLGLIHYYDLPLPPFYDASWPDAFVLGSHPWAARIPRPRGKTRVQMWREVCALDPDVLPIVEEAARYFDSAEEALEALDT